MLNEDVTGKFLRYISVDTASDDTTGTSPSTEGQFVLAKLLIDELIEIGIRMKTSFSMMSTAISTARSGLHQVSATTLRRSAL